MLTLLMNLMIFMSMIFLFLNHPLSLGMILMAQTIIISMISGLLNYNFWFSYILFLIMIGGMLILFIYMTSIASNEKFKFSPNLMLLTMTMLFTTMLLMMVDFYFMNSIMCTYDILNQNMIKNNNFSMNKYMNYPTNLIFFMIIIYLLITLIMIVKITNFNYGPLRQKF